MIFTCTEPKIRQKFLIRALQRLHDAAKSPKHLRARTGK